MSLRAAMDPLWYSQRLREWITKVRMPQTHLRGPKPRFWAVDPSAASFRVQLHRDQVNAVPGDNEVLNGIRLTSNLLARQRLKVARSCKALIREIPGYSWDDKAAEKGEDVPIKADDRGVDALRYGLKTTEGAWRPKVRAD